MDRKRISFDIYDFIIKIIVLGLCSLQYLTSTRLSTEKISSFV